VRFVPGAGTIDTVGVMSVPNLEERWRASPVSGMFNPGEHGMAMFSLRGEPFGTQDAWGVMPDGRIVVARADRYRLEFMRDGEVVGSGRVVPFEPVSVTRADRRAFLDRRERTRQGGNMSFSLQGGGSRPVSGRPGDADIFFPEVKPPFGLGALKVAPDGTVWVQRNVAFGAQTLLDVFRPDGNRLYQVLLPPDRALLGVSGSHIYAVSYNDLDEQIIERYPL
jgi:hypothetical protein